MNNNWSECIINLIESFGDDKPNQIKFSELNNARFFLNEVGEIYIKFEVYDKTTSHNAAMIRKISGCISDNQIGFMCEMSPDVMVWPLDIDIYDEDDCIFRSFDGKIFDNTSKVKE